MSDPKIRIRRSSTPNKVPTITQLELGELAINTYDGKLYLEQDQGAAGVGNTVVRVNPWNVGLGTTAYNISFTAGKVGIGTTVAESALDVYGGANFAGNLTVTGTIPSITLTDSDHNPDFQILANVGNFTIKDVTNDESIIYIEPSGTINLAKNVNALAGIDITGDLTVSRDAIVTRDLDVDGHTNLDNVSIVGNSTITSSGSGTGKLRIEGAVQGNKIHLHRASTDSVSIRYQNNFGSLYAGLRNGFNNDQRFAISNSGTLGNNTIFQASENYNVIVGTAVTFSGTTGDATFTGIITAVDGTFSGDLDVDGHTDLDNVSVSGVSTFSSNVRLLNDDKLQFGDTQALEVYHDGTNSHIVNNSGYLTIQSQAGVNGIFIARNAEVNLYHGSSVRLQTSSSGVTINRDIDVDGHTNLDNVSVAGVTTFVGDVEFNNGIKDKDGELGTSGQVLSSTGSQLNWVAAQSGPTGAQGATGPTGAQGATGATGAQGATGPTGAQGADGNFGGATFDYTFDNNTSDSDPGNGRLKLNNTNRTSATVIYIDDVDDGGADIQAFLRTIDDSTSTIKGHVRISNRTTASDFALYTISGTNTEASGYHKINVSYVSGGSATGFSHNEDVIITFARTGTKGDTGAQGAAGSNGSTGAQGAAGSNGSTGAQGATGSTGPTGPTGAQGDDGSAGSTGAQGAAGSNGSTGAQGATGPTGAQGATAAQGAQGATGAGGPTGAQGAQGAQGASGEASGGANVSVSSNPPNSPDGGDLWWDSDVGELFIYYADGDSNQWVETSGGSETVTVSDNAPSSPNSGDLWWESDTGQLKLYYNDGDSAQWVDANAGVLSKLTVWETTSAGINTVGPVGINSTIPQATLDIHDIGSTGPCLLLRGASGTEGDIVTIDGEALGFGHWNIDSSTYTERLRIKADGNVGINTSPESLFHISSGTSGDCELIIEADTDNNNENDNPRIIFRQDGGVSVSAIGNQNNELVLANSVSSGGIVFKTGTTPGFGNATQKFKIFASGNATLTGSLTQNSSDIRLKTNIQPITNSLEKVKSLSGFTYNWNKTAQDIGFEGEEYDELQVGLSAQDVEKIQPEVVKPAPIDNNFKTIQYEKLVPLLVEAIKEQQEQIEALEAEVAALKSS